MASSISHQLTSRVKLLQKAALWHDGRVLIMQRSEKARSRPGLWDLPGGNAEWPEDTTADIRDPHEYDLIREVREETGIELDRVEMTTENSCYVGSYYDADADIYTVILGWRFELPAALSSEAFDPREIELSHEHTEFEWITADEFIEYDFGFAGEPGGFLREIVQ